MLLFHHGVRGVAAAASAGFRTLNFSGQIFDSITHPVEMNWYTKETKVVMAAKIYVTASFFSLGSFQN